jgi:hypothetical protein
MLDIHRPVWASRIEHRSPVPVHIPLSRKKQDIVFTAVDDVEKPVFVQVTADDGMVTDTLRPTPEQWTACGHPRSDGVS